jgi:predicted Zn-dependent peptidase
VSLVEELFSDWSGATPTLEAPEVVSEPVFQHIQQDTAQVQIGIAYKGVPSTDVDFYNYRVATSVLSGGMGARLFTEVREKRGLVYSVSAGAHSHRGIGFTLAYAGTQPERAQESLDVLTGELVRMKDGVTEQEVERAKIGMLSGLVMQEESSRARAGAIARDMWMLGRVRSLDEVTEKINAVTAASIAEFYDRSPAKDFSIVTLGPRELQRPRIEG